MRARRRTPAALTPHGTAAHRRDGALGYGVGHADVIFGYDAADRLAVTNRAVSCRPTSRLTRRT